MSLTLTRPQRIATACVALAALASLCIQFIAESEQLGDAATVPRVLWLMARYFTILTNSAVALSFGITALKGVWSGPGWPTAVTVWIVTTGVVYHALLASTNVSIGIEVWSNFGMHTLVPILTALLWLGAAPKAPLTYLHPLLWTLYPLLYATYAILRGLIDGRFPYFFLDPAHIGWPMVSTFVLGLGVFFVASCSALVLIARALTQARPTTL